MHLDQLADNIANAITKKLIDKTSGDCNIKFLDNFERS